MEKSALERRRRSIDITRRWRSRWSLAALLSGAAREPLASPIVDTGAPIQEGDAVPIELGIIHSFENTVNEPVEFLIVGVARDLTKHVDAIGRGARRGN